MAVSERLSFSTSYPAEITHRWSFKLDGRLKPREKDTLFEFGLIAAGRAKVFHVLMLTINTVLIQLFSAFR